jgi:hypothetical protein
MNYIKHIVSPDSITILTTGKPVTIRKQHYGFIGLLADLKAGRFDRLEQFLDSTKAIQRAVSANIVLRGNEVLYKGVSLHQVVSDKLLSLLRDGYGANRGFLNYLENLLQNSSYLSVRELYDFLSYRELPIDEDGFVYAFKGVQNDLYSVMGNLSTVVLKGTVDKTGHIYNGVGEEIEVLRRCVDDDRRNSCSHGLHLGSMDYSRSWGNRLLLCRFNPKDAVSVPTDSSCQKLRVCAYTVVEELDKEEKVILPPLYSRNERISSLVRKYLNSRDSFATIRQIHGALRIKGLGVEELFNILSSNSLFSCSPLVSEKGFGAVVVKSK